MQLQTDEIHGLKSAWQRSHAGCSRKLEFTVVSSTEERSIDDVTPQRSPAGMGIDKVMLLLVLQACQRANIAQSSDSDAISEDGGDSCGPDVTKIPLDAVVLVVRVVEQGLLLRCHAGTVGGHSGRKGSDEQWSVV